MIVQYVIDWESLYDAWFHKQAEDGLAQDVMNNFIDHLRFLRKCIEKNGLLYQDEKGYILSGLRKMLKEMGGEAQPLFNEWIPLVDELTAYEKLYNNPSYRTLLKTSAKKEDDAKIILIEGDEYLRSTRINRKVYHYPAVVISEEDSALSCDDGFSRCHLKEYRNSEEEKLRSNWIEKGIISINYGDKSSSDQLLSAMAVSAGAGNGAVLLLDPFWHQKTLEEKNKAWLKSTKYLLSFFGKCKDVKSVEFISEKRATSFSEDLFVDIVCDVHRDCPEKKSFSVRLKEEEVIGGRRVFHNRYISFGRFLFQISDGLDIMDSKDYIRHFDIGFQEKKENQRYAKIIVKEEDDVDAIHLVVERGIVEKLRGDVSDEEKPF